MFGKENSTEMLFFLAEDLFTTSGAQAGAKRSWW
jgi:hypothetical protein